MSGLLISKEAFMQRRMTTGDFGSDIEVRNNISVNYSAISTTLKLIYVQSLFSTMLTLRVNILNRQITEIHLLKIFLTHAMLKQIGHSKYSLARKNTSRKLANTLKEKNHRSRIDL
jgi:hypothetical protein